MSAEMIVGLAMILITAVCSVVAAFLSRGARLEVAELKLYMMQQNKPYDDWMASSKVVLEKMEHRCERHTLQCEEDRKRLWKELGRFGNKLVAHESAPTHKAVLQPPMGLSHVSGGGND